MLTPTRMSTVSVLFLLATLRVWGTLQHPYPGKGKGAGEVRQEIFVVLFVYFLFLLGVGWGGVVVCFGFCVFFFLNQSCSVFRDSLRLLAQLRKNLAQYQYIYFFYPLIFFIAQL